MTAVATWHAPPGYRLVTTSKVIRLDARLYASPSAADRRAVALNDARELPTLEWRAEPTDWAWRVVAYANRVEPIDPEYDALTLCDGCGDVPVAGGCGLGDCPNREWGIAA